MVPALTRCDAPAAISLALIAAAAGTGAALGARDLQGRASSDAGTGAARERRPRFDCAAAGTSRHEAYRTGRAQANWDIAGGRPLWLTVGLPQPWRPVLADVLDERHGVQLVPVVDCALDDQLYWYVQGYDDVIEAWLDETHHSGIDRAVADARAEYRARLDDPFGDPLRRLDLVP